GVFAIYKALDLPVVPVALNSGVFWPKQSFTKRAGTIRLEIIEAIAPGLERKEFMDLLELKIEQTSKNLLP
ncbi:MAG: 1-acyl-sn-glycerol-3-phosphate acyltransferase, partial [Pseudomonadota bacterium]|nr:1-acyl-sn-glycerol-3-phosphate acyltransferase [Pseudomonadota bacterium]